MPRSCQAHRRGTCPTQFDPIPHTIQSPVRKNASGNSPIPNAPASHVTRRCANVFVMSPLLAVRQGSAVFAPLQVGNEIFRPGPRRYPQGTNAVCHQPGVHHFVVRFIFPFPTFGTLPKRTGRCLGARRRKRRRWSALESPDQEPWCLCHDIEFIQSGPKSIIAERVGDEVDGGPSPKKTRGGPHRAPPHGDLRLALEVATEDRLVISLQREQLVITDLAYRRPPAPSDSGARPLPLPVFPLLSPAARALRQQEVPASGR